MPRAASITAVPSFLSRPRPKTRSRGPTTPMAPTASERRSKDRRGDAALAEHGFLLLEGVASLPDCVEVPPQGRSGDKRVGRSASWALPR